MSQLNLNTLFRVFHYNQAFEYLQNKYKGKRKKDLILYNLLYKLVHI